MSYEAKGFAGAAAFGAVLAVLMWFKPVAALVVGSTVAVVALGLLLRLGHANKQASSHAGPTKRSTALPF